MAIEQTGKSRASRIQLDYIHRDDNIALWRRRATIGGLIAAGALASLAVLGNRGVFLSTGELSNPHAHVEQDCQQCHIAAGDMGNFGAALAADGWSFRSEKSLRHQDTTCNTKCHSVDGHFRMSLNSVFEARDRDCTNCHNEHLGRHEQIAAVDNNNCTQCHDSLLDTVCPDATTTLTASIASFHAESHPDFPWVGSLAADPDPGRVKFNHALHLTPGLLPPDVYQSAINGAEPIPGAMLLEWLSENSRARYLKDGQSLESMVQLGCSDCHDLNAGQTDISNAADGQSSYFSPIRFDKHCSACHALNYAGQNQDNLPLPHAAPWAEINTLLSAKIKGGALSGSILRPWERAKNDGIKRDQGIIKASEHTFERVLLSAAEDTVRKRCIECHAASDLSDEAIDRSRAAEYSSLIPGRWLHKGRFDHGAHSVVEKLPANTRGVACDFCHSVRANPLAPDDNVVMIKGITTCTPCHRDVGKPMPADASAKLGDFANGFDWASNDCTTCHRYHWTRPKPGGNAAQHLSSTEVGEP